MAKHNVMLVEDNLISRLLMKRLVQKAGHYVKAFPDAKKALNLLRVNGSMDHIITDFKMPDINGVEFLKILRALPAYKRTPVMICSAFLGEIRSDELIGLGPVVLEPKPIRKGVLDDFIRDIHTMTIQ